MYTGCSKLDITYTYMQWLSWEMCQTENNVSFESCFILNIKSIIYHYNFEMPKCFYTNYYSGFFLIILVWILKLKSKHVHRIHIKYSTYMYHVKLIVSVAKLSIQFLMCCIVFVCRKWFYTLSLSSLNISSCFITHV